MLVKLENVTKWFQVYLENFRVRFESENNTLKVFLSYNCEEVIYENYFYLLNDSRWIFFNPPCNSSDGYVLSLCSSYAQEIETSKYMGETVFAILLSLVGLILFADLIGNVQVLFAFNSHACYNI